MSHSPVTINSSQIALLSGSASRAVEPSVVRPPVQLLRGREAIVAKWEMLQTLCERTGQTGVMHWLDYQISKPTEAKKIPTMLLVGLPENMSPAEATADDVLGVVMLYEYKFASIGLQLFATADMVGRRTVIAPAAMRTQVAEAACAKLIEQGALAVMITYMPEAQPLSARERPAAKFEMARQERSVPLGLVLGSTFDETLATLGKHTRRNLRSYRRRLESDRGSEFVPQAEISRTDFLTFNQASMNPFSDAMARFRYDSAQSESGMMFAGMRAQDGQWLSLIGGRRYRDALDIDWQMNLAGMTHYSLSTVMRSYVLEHETGLGTKNMVFTGGTPHSIRHSFACVEATDLVALRRSFAGRALRSLSRRLLRGNFMGQTLSNDQLRWE
jgi:hypothetical protein